MTEHAGPVVVAYDGSPESHAAIKAAATLFAGRELVVVSVWEPGLAMAGLEWNPDTTGVAYPMRSPEEIAMVDRIESEHATSTADAGVALARELGATARGMPVPDTLRVADAVHQVAEQEDAAVVVVGSRGLGRIKSSLLGSTSQRLLHDSKRPVLVVRSHEERHS